LLRKNNADEMHTMDWYSASTTISVGHHLTGVLNDYLIIIEEKQRFLKCNRHLKRLDEQVR